MFEHLQLILSVILQNPPKTIKLSSCTKSHFKATLSPNTQNRVYYNGMTRALSLSLSLLHFKLIKAEFSFIIIKWMMCEKTLNPSLIVWMGMCVFPCQLLDYQWNRLLHHLRWLLLPGVSAQPGHVCRGDAADLRTQRQTQQPHAAGRGLYAQWSGLRLSFMIKKKKLSVCCNNSLD